MKRDPEPVGDLIDAVLSRLGVHRPPDTVELISRWAEIAGSPWAERAVPAALRDGILIVEVADGGTAALLKYRSGELIRRLEEAFSPGVVNTVRVRVARRG